MRAAGPLALAALLVAAPVAAQDRRDGPPLSPSYADPSAVIAAELAFARDAQERGQWTAFAAAAAPDAVMFVPQMVWAQAWLKGRANPPAAPRWQPREVWSSCDGSLVVSHGTWQGGKGAAGWFTTLWQRQPKGDYKWVLDHGDAAGEGTGANANADADADMIAAHVADCPPSRRLPGMGAGEGGAAQRRPHPPKPPKLTLRDLPPLDPSRRSGAATDRTLRWEMTVTPAGGRRLVLTWTKDGAERTFRTERVADRPASG